MNAIRKSIQIVALLFVVCVWASAQEGSLGRVTGSVYDSNDAVILGTKVTLSSDKVQKTAVVNEDGKFSFAVPPSVYSITTEQNWWFPVRRANFMVVAWKTVVINLQPELETFSQALVFDRKGLRDVYQYNTLPRLAELKPFPDSPLNVVIEYRRSGRRGTTTTYTQAQLTSNELSIKADVLRLNAQTLSVEASGNVTVDRGGDRHKLDRVSVQLGLGSSTQKLGTGYAPVNGLKMYYEIRGNGEPVVLLHGAFMAITGDWNDWVNDLAKTRKVIAVELQGHGRTADIERDITYENLADDVARLLKYLEIWRADLVGYSLGAGVAIECAIRHPSMVRKVVSISIPIRRDGWVAEANDAWQNLTWETLKGTPAETEWKKLNPAPDKFPDFFNHLKATALRPYDFGADNLKATKAPIFFIHGDADGVRLEHIMEMFRLKGGGVFGDLHPRSESRLAILPDTTHVTLMSRRTMIIPMVNDFLDAQPPKP